MTRNEDAGMPVQIRMAGLPNPLTIEPSLFLPTAPIGRRQAKLALGTVLVSTLVFVAILPFVTKPLTQANAFISTYESALVTCDLITAVLLFSHFNVLRTRALYVLASGYMFSAVIAFVHMLTFPDLFSSSGLLGAGPQTTAWLYLSWHSGFPIFVVLYALLKNERRGPLRTARASSDKADFTNMIGVAAILAIVCVITLVATANHGLLPVLLVNSRFTPLLTVCISGCLILCLIAIGMPW
jgi:hypothetical protein